MTARLRIRPATRDDLATILALLAELARYERLTRRNRSTLASLRRAMFGKRAFMEGLIAERGGEPVGMALFYPCHSTFGATIGLWLEDLVVVPGRRGGGIGRALMARLARLSRARGWGFMAWSVLDWNRPALRFYRGLGARPQRGWTDYRFDGAALDRLSRAPSSASGRRTTARRR